MPPSRRLARTVIREQINRTSEWLHHANTMYIGSVALSDILVKETKMAAEHRGGWQPSWKWRQTYFVPKCVLLSVLVLGTLSVFSLGFYLLELVFFIHLFVCLFVYLWIYLFIWELGSLFISSYIHYLSIC